MKHTPVHYEQYLIRDLADMAIEYASDKNALEYISSVCFNLDMIFESDNNPAPWSTLFTITDQAAFDTSSIGISKENLEKIKEISKKYQEKINQSSPRHQ